MAFYPQLGDVDWNVLAQAGTNMLSSTLMAGIKSARLETAYFPPLDLISPGSAAPSPAEGVLASIDLGAILKPKLTVQLAIGNPIVYAPYGDPGQGSWLPLFGVVVGSLALAYYAGRRSKR